MKKVFFFVAMVLMIAPVLSSAYAAGERELTIKERVEKTRKSEKADKEGKKLAKQNTQKGWQEFEGTGLLEKQFAEQVAYERTTNDDGEPYFYRGVGSFTGNNKNEALRFAKKNALQDIASQIKTSLSSSGKLGSYSEGSGDNVNTVISASNTMMDDVVAKLEGVRPIVQMYRKEHGLYEVNVVVFYSRLAADKIASESYAKSFKGNPELEERAKAALEKMNEE